MSSFHISKSNPSHIHLKWNNALKPILTVDSGAELSFDLLDGGHNQLTDRSTVADVSNFNFDLVRRALYQKVTLTPQLPLTRFSFLFKIQQCVSTILGNPSVNAPVAIVIH
jgi:hypothetical protein